MEVHRSGDEEDVVAAGDGLVEAAFDVQVTAEDCEGAVRLQVLEVGVLGHVVWDFEFNQNIINIEDSLIVFIMTACDNQVIVEPGFLTVVLTA